MDDTQNVASKRRHLGGVSSAKGDWNKEDGHQGAILLRPREDVAIDVSRLKHLHDSATVDQADWPVAEALEDLALQLSRCAAAYRLNRLQDLSEVCLAIAQISSMLGLDRLTRVARTVAVLASGSDCVALGANLARLMRLGYDALTAIWDYQDRIG